jgi:hypothetical protein
MKGMEKDLMGGIVMFANGLMPINFGMTKRQTF